MNRPIDRPEALGRTLDVLNERWASLILSEQKDFEVMDITAGELTWCQDLLALYRDISVVEFLRALKRVHDEGGWLHDVEVKPDAITMIHKGITI